MTKTATQTGRPPKVKRPTIYSTKLYKLMQETLPLEFISEDGKVNTLALSTKMNNKRMTIYRWFQGFNMSVKSANQLAELSAAAKCEKKGRLTIDKLLPFVGL